MSTGRDDVARAVQRLAVLLTAGLDPRSALAAIDDAPAPLAAAAACASPHDVPGALVASVEERGAQPRGAGDAARGAGGAGVRGSGGAGVRAADDGDAWRLVAAVWAVALETGAPLSATLERAAETLRTLADAERQVDLAITGPLATARIVALLPLAGLGMGALIGSDPLGVLLGTVPGGIAGVLGVALLVAGLRWNGRLVRAARVFDEHAGLGSELLALALAGGAPPARGEELVRDAVTRCGVEVDVADGRATVEFATRAGVPAASLLRAEAASARRLALADALARSALLGSRLLAPLSLCFLPAFVLVGVVPLLVGMLRSTLEAW